MRVPWSECSSGVSGSTRTSLSLRAPLIRPARSACLRCTPAKGWSSPWSSCPRWRHSAFKSSLCGMDVNTGVDSRAITAALESLGIPFAEYTERGQATTFAHLSAVPLEAVNWQAWDRGVVFDDTLYLSATGIGNYLA